MYRPLVPGLAALALTIGSCEPAPSEPDAREVLARAAEYLWAQQAEDGGWHSAEHGIARGGQAWTPFVLHALLQVPPEVAPAPAGAAERALEFLRARVDPVGALGLASPPVLEYPNYSTAYALRIFAAHGAPAPGSGPGQADSALVRRMAAYLAGQQFTEARGFTPDRLEYGAWGFGETNLDPGESGHVDLSHTRRVLGALRAAGALDSSAAAAATAFLRILQKHPEDDRPQPPGDSAGTYDGGFYASSVTLGVNKGGVLPDGTFRPYATATADGLIGLVEAGHSVDGEPVQAALRWLREHPDWDFPTGLPEDDPAQWQRVMRLYHLATRAEAYSLVGETDWQDEAAAVLASLQRDDGSFSNPDGGANKEDDPLLGTALAIEALVRVMGDG
jgi:hypothetical protein